MPCEKCLDWHILRPMTMAAVPLIIPLALFLGAFTGTILMIASRRKGRAYPSCGNCGYDLTGSLGQ